jgi:hypothetical protein
MIYILHGVTLYPGLINADMFVAFLTNNYYIYGEIGKKMLRRLSYSGQSNGRAEKQNWFLALKLRAI